jgi:hypothetical protein
MFHNRTSHFLVSIILLGFSAQSTTSYANDQVFSDTPAEVSKTSTQNIKKSNSYSFLDIQNISKKKYQETKHLVKEKIGIAPHENPLKTLETKVDRLQDQVKPVGNSLKVSFKKHAPKQTFLQRADSKFSVYGFLLIFAFGTVCLLMSLSGPTSRLGGRH